MKHYTKAQRERFHSLINDLAENMPMKRWSKRECLYCVDYLASELHTQRQDFNEYHGKLVTIASKMCHDVICAYPSPKE